MNYHEKLINKYYSAHYSRFMPTTATEWQWVLDRIDLNFGKFFDALARNSLILDVPCGIGYLEHYLLKKGFTKIHAIDLSEEQIQVAKSKLQEYGLEYNDKVEFHIADAFEYLMVNDGYAAIAMIDFLDHLEKDKILEILDLANKALRAEGLLLVRVTNADNPMWGRFFYRDFTRQTPFTPDTLRQCLSVTGFDVVKIDYEALPKRGKALSQVKQGIRWIGLWLLGKFLSLPPAAFTEDLIAIARKP